VAHQVISDWIASANLPPPYTETKQWPPQRKTGVPILHHTVLHGPLRATEEKVGCHDEYCIIL